MKNIDDFNKSKKELEIEEKANEIYGNQKSVKAAVLSAVPFFGAFLDEFSDQRFEAYQTKKRMALVETILQNKDLITRDMVNNVEFIINIAKTISAVDRTASADKVVFYGNLVRNGYFSNETISNDCFEEYLAVLSDLSFREIQYLAVFAERARQHDYKLEGTFLADYYRFMSAKNPEINPSIILNRLKRTGFVNTINEWADFGVEDTKDVHGAGSLVFGDNSAFRLEYAYDDFEEVVLTKYDGSLSINL